MVYYSSYVSQLNHSDGMDSVIMGQSVRGKTSTISSSFREMETCPI
jgi:hypothetical protein